MKKTRNKKITKIKVKIILQIRNKIKNKKENIHKI